MKKPSTTLAAVIASTVIAVGCLVPERFTAKVDVHPDASYSFHYSGSAIHVLAAAQIKEAGSLSEKEEKDFRSEAEKLSKNNEIRKAVYRGAGRYDLEIDTTKKAGQPLRTLNVFSVRTDEKGVMTITTTELKEKDRRELAELGITIDGTLEVNIPKNAEVISHNATSTPTLGFGSFSWKIGRIDQRPMMKIKVSKH